ncbi:MAG: DSD1 family PLP-dependent enzyme [Armatimonadetes bacterium]|nr:DSD1 family PLP-dependent enzyme [Armatimonadota bacterium]
MSGYTGVAVVDLDTPALVVDLDAMDRNITRMTRVFREAGVAWRPHTKGIKVPAIAHRLLDAGAIGVTCAKVSEAEVMVAAGIRSVLIANQVVGEYKVRRLASLCRWADVMSAVDHPENIRQMGSIAREAGVRVGVLIEVNIGMNRCGVEPGEPALELAKVVRDTEGLVFKGLMGWEGHTQRVEDPGEKLRAVGAAVGALRRSAEICRQAGIPVEIVSCGGTGTYRQTAVQPGVTEIQAGGGVWGDMYYHGTGAESEFALTVLTTVTSRPAPTRVVADAGKKTMSSDVAAPKPRDLHGVTKVRLSAEHCTLELERPVEAPRVGDKLTFIVGYSDTTVCLHDVLFGARNGVVEVAWPILGRGKLQ